MNNFLTTFRERLIAFWRTSTENEKIKMLDDVLSYANLNRQSFLKELKEIQFDPMLSPLPVVLEALSKDTETWGDFYVDVLDEILEKAEQIAKPTDVLTYISEFYYIESDTRPFVQKIVDKLKKALDSEKIEIQLNAICTLPSYLTNSSIKDKELLLERLREKLDDSNWKVRYVAFRYLGFENLLPPGQKLRMTDKIMKLVFGEPAAM